MNYITARVLMDMNRTSPDFWRSFCYSSFEVFSLTVIMLYPDVTDIQFSLLQQALKDGI